MTWRFPKFLETVECLVRVRIFTAVFAWNWCSDVSGNDDCRFIKRPLSFQTQETGSFTRMGTLGPSSFLFTYFQVSGGEWDSMCQEYVGDPQINTLRIKLPQKLWDWVDLAMVDCCVGRGSTRKARRIGVGWGITHRNHLLDFFILVNK